MCARLRRRPSTSPSTNAPSIDRRATKGQPADICQSSQPTGASRTRYTKKVMKKRSIEGEINTMENSKPIRVFYSEFSGRFYASRAYKQIKPGIVEITGQKFDVTNDIARHVLQHDIQFTKIEEHDAKPT